MTFSAQTFSSRIRSRWRKSLWALTAVFLLTSFIELTHSHYLESGTDNYECAVCQHSVSFDKTLASSFNIHFSANTTEALLVLAVSQTLAEKRTSYQSRAPPALPLV